MFDRLICNIEHVDHLETCISNMTHNHFQTRSGQDVISAKTSSFSTKPSSHLNGVLADAQRVPQLDGFIPRAGHDLPVIGGEGHAQHVFGVAHKATGRGSSTNHIRRAK